MKALAFFTRRREDWLERRTGRLPGQDGGMPVRTRIAVGAAAVGLSLAVFGGAAGADHLDKNEAAEACREAEDQGVLEELGITRGECVNSLGTPGSENASSRIAALCGQEFAQQFTGTSNKGQCIQVLST